MPLIRRKIQPSCLSRRPTDSEEVKLDYDLSAVTNVTLCNAVQQLASILLAAESVYSQLNKELDSISKNAQNLSGRLSTLEKAVSSHNPKAVTVPEGDLRSFSLRKENFCSRKPVTSFLFTAANQPEDVTKLYNECSSASSGPDNAPEEGHVVCEPVLADSLKREKLRKLNLDIETRRPASFVALRDWCSDDDTLVNESDLLPVSPATPLHHPPNPHPSGQKLPLPEQRLEALSHKYPPKLVPIDVSGSGFKRMQVFRQSLVKFEYGKTKKRKRLKRRNTIANTREIQSSTLPSTSSCQERSSSSRFGFSLTDRSFDTSSTKTSCERELPHHLLGFHVSVPTPPCNVNNTEKLWHKEVREVIIDAEIHHSSPRLQQKLTARKLDMAGCRDDDSCHSDAGCQENSSCHIATNFETTARPTIKLREGSSREEGTRSSSGNWSGSSSTATSIESDPQPHIPDTSPPNPESATNSPEPSISQDSFISDSLGALNSSLLLSSDGTLTPCEDIPFADDDTSSAFSCDAEGYYTSFHTDSGLFYSDVPRTGYDLKLDSDCDVCRTSTGTTNSSASLKTVVMRNPERKVPPKPPQRVSSLDKEKRESIITVIHLNGSTSSREDIPGSSRSISSQNSGDSSRSVSSQESELSRTDSGRDTLSSTRDKTNRTEAEGQNIGKKDDFRSKTAINTIPSMCAITPPLSDEEKCGGQVIQVEKPLAAVETKLYQKSLQQTPAMRSAGVRQPGDGAVAPPAVVTRTKDKKPNLILMSQKRASAGDIAPSLKERLPEVSSSPKPYVEPYTLDKSVGERRAEIQSIFKDKIIAGGDPQKIARSQTPQNDHPIEARPHNDHQSHPIRETVIDRPSQSTTTKSDTQRATVLSQHGDLVDLPIHHKEAKNFVAYKQLPAMSSNVPFSAVSSGMKKPHPTNSLDRRSNSKITAHVALDGEGKVVYSSDSLPRRKGHASFEPGPYVKPPPISSDTNSQLKNKSAGYYSIQNMPLPPVPLETAAAQTKAAQLQFAQHKQQQPSASTKLTQPKTTAQHITTVSHTLSGLSSQLQPRTVSEINALRNSKSKPNTSENDDSPKLDYCSDSEESSLQQRIQQQLKIRMDARNDASSPSLPGSNYQYKKPEGKCHTLPNRKHGQDHSLSYQSLSYQQQLIKQAYQQQQQLQQLQEEQQRKKQQNIVTFQSLTNPSKDADGTILTGGLSKIPEASYPARQNLQQSIYQSQNEILRQQPSTTDGSRLKNESILPQTTSMGPLGPSPVYQTQMDPSMALAQQQMQAAQAASLGEHAVLHTRQHNPSYHVTSASRVSTPIQDTSSPNRLTNSSNPLQYPLRSQTGAIYASQRSLQGGMYQTDRRATPIPHAMSQSPPPYDQYNVTNSDIYGRIGMTRQVFVGGTLPAAFNRNHRAYSSLPPNLRHPVLSAETLQRVNQNVERALARRASVLGTETAQPETPAANEKLTDKKNNKKDKKKKENKTDKPKKKWFWTLPLRRKKKEQEGEDDEGGFKDSTQKTTRPVPPQEDTSFIRYPSPDTGSTDMNSSYSSDSSDHYRTPAEAYYYQKSQLAQLQQHRSIIDNTINSGHTQMAPVIPPITSIPRSHSATVVSPQEAQASNIPSANVENDMTDLTRSRRYMSRDELYAAMRHPQYYNNSRNSMSSEHSSNSTPSSSRSNSPAVFGMTPPAYAIKPQVRENYGNDVLSPRNLQEKPSVSRSLSDSRDSQNAFQTKDIAPPMGYGEIAGNGVPANKNSAVQSSKPASKQTSITDFKKMILEKSMITVCGKERVSAVEMLRASRPNIYGYSPPPIADVSKPIEHQPMPSKGHGIIMPPNSRNTARALLFQSRFGSGGRYRTPKTEIISTTIVEDKMQEDIMEEEEESSEEEMSSGSSPERSSVISVKCSKNIPKCSTEDTKKEMDHSTPMKDTESSLVTPNVSIILPPNSADNSRADAETSL